ncbi:RNA polymerase sigma factor [Patescibacteria group bacterium]|nr:RNA polymerase sigma factor [Patescibacteria group bacterium]
MNQFDDNQLVEIIRTKNQELFSELIIRYQHKLFYYVNRLINHPDEAEDVVQDVFLKVYKNLHGYDAKLKFSSWIYRIAHNEAVNWLRRNTKIKLESIEQSEYLENVLSDGRDITEELDLKVSIEKVRRGMDQLPRKYREVMILKFLEEKSYEEISDILRKPVSTIGVLINRAKKMLKDNNI